MQHFVTVTQCENYLFQLRGGDKRDEPLAVVQALLEAFNNPQQQVPFVHIAGTNGKGSTVNFLQEMLMAGNVRVGAFTSPHLEQVNERIRINGVYIDDATFIRYVNELMVVMQEQQLSPNFFEVMTVMAWRYFAEQQVDIALMEVGIGGRLDSTNVATPLASIITSIGFDHIDMLGDTLTEIASEKAGIIKAQVPVISTVLQQEALAVLAQTARQQQAPYYRYGDHFTVEPKNEYIQYQSDKRALIFTLQMQGAHQMRNAAAAITCIDCLAPYVTLTNEHMQQGLARAMWAGRFEEIRPRIFIDGAHNEQGTAALVETLTQMYPAKRYHFIYAAMRDKDHTNSIAQMDAIAETITFTTLPMPRAATAEALYAHSTHRQKAYTNDWQQAIMSRIKQLTPQDLLIVTGSLYFISEARPFMQQLEA